MEDVLVKLNVGLLWLKLHSTRRGLVLLAHWIWFEEEASELLHLEHSCIWCWDLDDWCSRSETPGKFWNVVLEKDGKDQLDRSCEKWRSVRVKEQRNISHEISKRKVNCTGHILRRNCLLQGVIEGKIKGGIEVTGKRGRRHRKLLDDLKRRRGYSHLKKEALDSTVFRGRFGRGFGLS